MFKIKKKFNSRFFIYFMLDDLSKVLKKNEADVFVLDI